ncbi:bile acid:sodium symporter [Pseudorhodoferax sp. Leaf267]|uniref:bile acid:sodium symporter n=1 Tax=Pseudorhodoferax sp. Leaf267 TaxID=1736316 RepID=UPI0006FA6B84|nr:bile acid:sodium symporter [Pseudorhodoferax sp. Leaf267]KQP18457.1 arsenic resistance protein [Pseudorhodoferax sp. Leaf267]
MLPLQNFLETRQPFLYFGAVAAGAAIALLVPGTEALEPAINPALALMLFLTFLQLPLATLGRALRDLRFIAALLGANFVAVPLLVAWLVPWLPADPMLRLGVLLVLLCPCIDYVVAFAQLGRADARLLLAATPVLLVAQMLLLPVYLALFLGHAADGLVQAEPFVQAFVWLIAAPLLLAGLCQRWAAGARAGGRVLGALALLPVPATALVLLVVVLAVLPRLDQAGAQALRVLPVYVGFAVVAPAMGWWLGRLARLPAAAARAVAFSAATRNALVVLPLALAVPGGMPLLPALVVTQTLVELVAELVYIRVLARWGRA